jgi:pimeloyl-ACP methyl ester carboxylesterase
MIARRAMLAGLAGFAGLGACGAVTDGIATRREAEAEALYPPPGEVAVVDGLRVHADRRGAGPDVVLIHGASGNSRDFTFSLADRIAAEGFRVTSFDRPGLGWSDDLGAAGVSPLVQADHLARAADAMGLHRPVVLGQSYGGAVAMAWALLRPDGVRGLVSVSGATNLWPGGIGAWYAMASGRVGESVLAPTISAFATRGMAARVLAGIFAPDPVPPGYLDHIGVELSFRRAAFVTNARQVAGLKRHIAVMEPNYPALRLPVEIIFGQEDSIVPPAIHGEVLARQVPGARLTLIEGAGHMPHQSHPEVVVAAIRRAAGFSA